MYKIQQINKILTNSHVFPKVCSYKQKVTSMIKCFKVRKTSEVLKYVSYWQIGLMMVM